MAPLKQVSENAGVLAGIIAAVTATFFAITGRSRERIGSIAVEAVRDSGEFVQVAQQNEVTRELREDIQEIKGNVREIYHHLIGHGTRSGEDGIARYGNRVDDRHE